MPSSSEYIPIVHSWTPEQRAVASKKVTAPKSTAAASERLCRLFRPFPLPACTHHGGCVSPVSQDENDEPTSGNLTSNRDKLAKQAALGAQADKAVVKDDDDGEDDDGDWAMDTSAVAVKARQAKAQESLSRVAVKVRAAMVSSAEGDTAAAISSLMAIAKEHDIGPIDLFGLLLAEFNEAAVKQLSTHKTVLTKLMKASPDKKKTQKFILGQVEELLGERQKDALLKKTPVFLKAMYDIDLLDEQTIVKWFDKGSKKKLGKAVRNAAEPFVNWLKVADEEEDDDERPMGTRKTVAPPDPCRCATTSIIKPKTSHEDAKAAEIGTALLVQPDPPPQIESLTINGPLAPEPQPPPLPPPKALPRMPKSWKELPVDATSEMGKELLKRLLQCETTFGVIATVHLEKVEMWTGKNASVARTVYSWIFDAHHIVMGDMNCVWGNMIGGAPLDFGPNTSYDAMEAWVNPLTHRAAIRPCGTYLPSVTEPKKPRFPGDKITIAPPTFDIVVVAQHLKVELLPEKEQPGMKFLPAKLPRNLMNSLPWPSDHTSVVARVSTMHSTSSLTVATWNVADPHYFGRWYPLADLGFIKSEEKSRLLAIDRHVSQLLRLADVVGLQEVPSALVETLARRGDLEGFEVQWAVHVSGKDELYEKLVGIRGCSSDEGGISAAMPPPPAPHTMLFARYTVLANRECSHPRMGRRKANL